MLLNAFLRDNLLLLKGKEGFLSMTLGVIVRLRVTI